MKIEEFDISIIIVSYNTADYLVNCINSIIESVRKVTYEVIIVDNDSSDDTLKKVSNIKFHDSKLKLIKNAKNYGFSKANNIGIKESRGRYLLFLNPDTIVYKYALDGMVKFLDKHQDSGAATCYVELINGLLDDASHRGFPTPWRAFCHFSGLSKIFPRSKFLSGYGLGYKKINIIHEIDACAGAFMLVRRQAGKQVGWWDEDFFWYGEDLDFCYRLKEKGWKIYFNPEYKILHYKGISGGIKKISKKLSTANEETRQKAQKARFDAMSIFYKKHYLGKYPSFLNKIVLFGINLKYRASLL